MWATIYTLHQLEKALSLHHHHHYGGGGLPTSSSSSSTPPVLSISLITSLLQREPYSKIQICHELGVMDVMALLETFFNDDGQRAAAAALVLEKNETLELLPRILHVYSEAQRVKEFKVSR